MSTLKKNENNLVKLTQTDKKNACKAMGIYSATPHSLPQRQIIKKPSITVFILLLSMMWTKIILQLLG